MWKLTQAFNFVSECRPEIFPNIGFQKQLKKFEVYLGLVSEEDHEKEMKEKENNYTYID